MRNTRVALGIPACVYVKNESAKYKFKIKNAVELTNLSSGYGFHLMF